MSVLACQECGAALIAQGTRTASCPYCACPTVIERPEAPDQPRPTFVLAFAAGDALARTALRDWVARQSVFADPALRRAHVEDLKGIYVPGYVYSAMTRTAYRCSIGENYTETETYTETDSEGKQQTRTRTVTRTEWCELDGTHVGYTTDVVVSASRGLSHEELEAVEPFDFRALRRYDAAIISGWMAEEASRGRDECREAARGEAASKTGGIVEALMPGDTHRALACHTTVEWETLDPLLLPVWVLAVRHRPDRPPVRLVVNGQTGAAHGRAPLSKLRIALAVLLALALIAVVVYLVVRA